MINTTTTTATNHYHSFSHSLTHHSLPPSLSLGMNTFLKQLNITFRRDPTNFRPRINKGAFPYPSPFILSILPLSLPSSPSIFSILPPVFFYLPLLFLSPPSCSPFPPPVTPSLPSPCHSLPPPPPPVTPTLLLLPLSLPPSLRAITSTNIHPKPTDYTPFLIIPLGESVKDKEQKLSGNFFFIEDD